MADDNKRVLLMSEWFLGAYELLHNLLIFLLPNLCVTDSLLNQLE